MNQRHILAFLESRSTYGYSRNVLRAMGGDSRLRASCLVTGMHLMPELGNTVDLIRADGFEVSAEVPMAMEDNGSSAWSRALGHGIAGYASAMEDISPDILLLFGDRIETFGCCVAATYMGVPIAHVQAGDKSGHVDDLARMAMAKLVHIHFPSCKDSAERLRRLGEQDFRIFDVGAPQLDDIVGHDYRETSLDIDGQVHDLSDPYALLAQHPLMVEREASGSHMRETLEACLASGLRVFWLYPNADLGYREIIDVIREQGRSADVTVLPNLQREQYLSLMANAAVMVGNSSSGILEAPSFGLPVVNIGERQRGRPQATNVLNCDLDKPRIVEAIQRALRDEEFKKACRQAVNPYGDGQSGPRICKTLRDIPIDQALLDKETVY